MNQIIKGNKARLIKRTKIYYRTCFNNFFSPIVARDSFLFGIYFIFNLFKLYLNIYVQIFRYFHDICAALHIMLVLPTNLQNKVVSNRINKTRWWSEFVFSHVMITKINTLANLKSSSSKPTFQSTAYKLNFKSATRQFFNQIKDKNIG